MIAVHQVAGAFSPAECNEIVALAASADARDGFYSPVV